MVSVEARFQYFERLRHSGDHPTHFYLVRHGQTAGNVKHQLIGHTDVDLDELGVIQAQQVGLHLRTVRLDAVVSSPLARAHVTATEIARHQQLEVETEARLKEMHFGHAEGLTIAEAAERFPELMRLRDNPFDMEFRWPGGDHRGEFHARILTTFAELALVHQGRHVAVVCHGGVITSLVAQLDGGSPNDFNRYLFTNCSVTHLEIHTEGTTAHRLNDYTHLEAVRTEPWTFTIPGDMEDSTHGGDEKTT